MTRQLPELRLDDWKPTRDTLHRYAGIIGKMRSGHMPKSKHWWHITLNVSAGGWTTTPFPIAGRTLELALDLTTHRLVIDSSEGWSIAIPLAAQSESDICRGITSMLDAAGIGLEPDLLAAFDSDETLPYDAEAVRRFHQVVTWVDAAFKTFKGGLREETSPVQIFPHHMDLAMKTGSPAALCRGVDPADEENADEQMNFGFVTGDGSIPNAHFYATANPAPDGWTDLALPRAPTGIPKAGPARCYPIGQ